MLLLLQQYLSLLAAKQGGCLHAAAATAWQYMSSTSLLGMALIAWELAANTLLHDAPYHY
jgi:hypothetical protein